MVFVTPLEIPERLKEGGGGGGGSSLPYNSGKFREVGGSYVKFPLWWASGYFLKPHIFSSKGFFVVS